MFFSFLTASNYSAFYTFWDKFLGVPLKVFSVCSDVSPKYFANVSDRRLYLKWHETAILKHLNLIPYYFLASISLTEYSISQISTGLLKCIFKWLVGGNKLPLLLGLHFHWSERDPFYSLHVTGSHFFDYPEFSMLSEWIGVIWT